ncbi:hypothetical protein [Bdellovibrio sp.]|uniref:hypothetical protein n=1 Tax=Bdellovibrio sp. TaxID=28201 RepID=UPI0039E23BC5
MKKLFICLASGAVVIGCTTQSYLSSDTKRKTANTSENYSHNMQVLSSIPLFDGLETRKDNEFDIASVLIGIFNKIENESKNADNSLNRGTHAKGRCFEGDFTVFSNEELKNQFRYSDTLIDRLKQGFFAQDGDHKAEIRFANAMGAKNPDTVADVRGFSFSVETFGNLKDHSGGFRQDFMMNSSPMFAVNNIQEFLELMKTARLAGGDWDYFPNPFYLKSVIKAKRLLDQYQRADTKSYATEEYWANLPYSHGLRPDGQPVDIVKFKTTPCDGQSIQHESSVGKSADYLQADIIRRAQSGQVCFLFQVQFFDLNKAKGSLKGQRSRWTTSDWIENGGELWEETAMPFYTIAKIELKPESSREISCEDRYINTRLHSNRANQPLGSIARVRTMVEENSRARRMMEIR